MRTGVRARLQSGHSSPGGMCRCSTPLPISPRHHTQTHRTDLMSRASALEQHIDALWLINLGMPPRRAERRQRQRRRQDSTPPALPRCLRLHPLGRSFPPVRKPAKTWANTACPGARVGTLIIALPPKFMSVHGPESCDRASKQLLFAPPHSMCYVAFAASDRAIGGLCSEVRVDNSSHEAFTVISLEVQDYPGAPCSQFTRPRCQ